MYFLTSTLIVVSALSAVSQASSSVCFTSKATTSPKSKWSTQWSTHFTPCTSTSRLTKSTTVTPAAITSTSTSTVTSTVTVPTSILTSTVTTSSTEIDTATTTATVTVIGGTTTTTTTSTSTVAAPSGFLPIQSSLPGSTYDGTAGPDPISKRDLEGLSFAQASNNLIAKRSSPRDISIVKKAAQSKKPIKPSGNSYVCGVTCNSYAPSRKCATTVITTTTTSTAMIPTTTTTTTSTSIISFAPSATVTTTTTVSITTTTTSTVTNTVSQTQTQTVASVSTVYAACATNNFANYYNGQPIDNGGGGTYNDVGEVSANSAYDCCVAALTNPNGAAQIFLFMPSGQCYVGYVDGASTDTCIQANAQTNEVTGSDGPYVIGNGYCGEATS